MVLLSHTAKFCKNLWKKTPSYTMWLFNVYVIYVQFIICGTNQDKENTWPFIWILSRIDSNRMAWNCNFNYALESVHQYVLISIQDILCSNTRQALNNRSKLSEYLELDEISYTWKFKQYCFVMKWFQSNNDCSIPMGELEMHSFNSVKFRRQYR